jgi:hypothetical protein
MDEEKQRHLEQSGWKVGTVAEFLELTPEEAIILDSMLAADNAPIHKPQLLKNQASSPSIFDGTV